jgi:hypothetical protein
MGIGGKILHFKEVTQMNKLTTTAYALFLFDSKTLGEICAPY